MTNTQFFFWPEKNTTASPRHRNTNRRKKLCRVDCKLFRTCESPNMKPSGEGKRKVLVIAEAPGRVEDERGVQLVGKSGRLVRREMRSIGFDLDRDCIKLNAINCRPPDNRKPTRVELEACRPHTWKVINEFQPHVILLFGGIAVDCFLGHRWKRNLRGISRWRGWHIPDREVNAWVCPLFHPAYIIRSSSPPGAATIFSHDLERALKLVDKPLPTWEDERECVRIIRDEDRVVRFLTWLVDKRRPKVIAFDYETTGLKPHRDGHRIVSASVAYSKTKAVAFPMTHAVESAFVRLLRDRHIKKIAQNLKFEEAWSRVCLGTRVRGWVWDSMVASHVLDNRSGITGLKFQAYVQFGILDYSSHIEPYLESRGPGGANAFNRIDKVDMDELLLYNGMDSLLEYRLAMKQRKVLQ